MLKRLFLIMMLCLPLWALSACSEVVVSSAPEPVVVNVTVAAELEGEMSLAVDVFGEKLEELSGGRITAEVSYTENPLDDLTKGADFAYLPNELVAMANSDFLSFSSPYYFTGYDDMTMTLNSDTFLSEIHEQSVSLMDASPVRAYYAGSRVLVNARELPLSTPDTLTDIELYGYGGDDVMTYYFREAGADVVTKTEQELIDGFSSGIFPHIEINRSALDKLTLPPRATKLYITESYHHFAVNWMFITESGRQRFTNDDMAVINEALAYSLGESDGAVLELEQSALENAASYELIASDYSAYSELSANILSISVRYSILWNWELYHFAKGLI